MRHIKQLKATVRRFDENLTHSIQGMPQSVRPLMVVLSFLAQGSVIGPLAVGLIIAGKYGLVGAFEVGVTILLVSAAGFIVKISTRRTRPLGYITKGWIKTYSFPSGHTVAGTVTYGGLGYILLLYAGVLSIPGVIVAGIMIILGILIVGIGVSRVYLGAHFPSDVVVGWLFGVVGGMICYALLVGERWLPFA